MFAATPDGENEHACSLVPPSMGDQTPAEPRPEIGRSAFELTLPFALVGAGGAWLLAHLLHLGPARGGWLPWMVAGVAGCCGAVVGWFWSRPSTGPVARAGIFAAGAAVGGAATGALIDGPGANEMGMRVVGGASLGIFVALFFFAPLVVVVLAARRRVGRARRGSVADGSDRRRAWFRTAAAITIAAWLLRLAPWAETRGWLVAAISTTAGLVWIWLADLVALAGLFRSIRGAERSVDPVDVDHGPVTDLGIGEERWLCSGARAHPYRSTERVTRVLRGALFEVQDLLTRAALWHTGLALIAVFALLLAPSRASDTKTIVEVPSPVIPMVQQIQRGPQLAWYPQREPILVHLDGDGIEDVVGLRWDPTHEEAALSVVATDGATFRTVWSSAPIKSQWANPRTRLVRSGDHLYLTDSEGFIRVYVLATGREEAEFKVGDTTELCGSPSPPSAAWFRDTDDWKSLDRGIQLEGPTWQPFPAPRPAWCKNAGRRTCDSSKPGDGPCFSDKGLHPPSKSMSPSYALEDGDVGVAFGTPKTEGSRPEVYNSFLVGFDPKTGKARWEHPLQFDSAKLHSQPQLHTELAQGRVFGFYQLENGSWELGARDGMTGEVTWRREPPRALHGTNFASMTISPQRLYLVLNWRVEVFDQSSGESLGVIW